MESNKQSSAVRRGSKLNNTLLLRNNICFVYVKLYDDGAEQVLGNVEYTLRGLQSDTVIRGVTDEGGILRHEFLPDDHFELECGGETEVVEVYYMSEMDEYDHTPWCLRMRNVGKTNEKSLEE